MKVIDAERHVLGRLASVVAKELLNGEEIRIVNASKCIITGKKKMILARYRKKRALTHRRKGPFFPRGSDRIVKRTIKGMLPVKKTRGKEALKRLRVYVHVPKGLANEKRTKIDIAMELNTPNFVELGEIARLIGSKE